MAETVQTVRPDSDIICTCFELTRQGFLDLMAQHRELDFQEMLDKTGVGNKCTACRLDLELLYTENFDRMPRSKAGAVALPPAESAPWRQRVYALLDRISPMWPMPLRDWSPVLAGHGITEMVVVNNDPPLYANDAKVDPVEVTVSVRDAGGGLCHRRVETVNMDKPLNLDVSQYLPPPETAFPTIGSVEISRRWQRPTVRGTTRPQFVIGGPQGCGAVHTQAPSGKGATWYAALYRPGEDRILLSVINPSNRSLVVDFTYPYVAGAQPSHIETLPPHGASLHEVRLAPGSVSEDETFVIRVGANGSHKCHLLTADRALTRFAVDHPASG
ncbi:hypothetical protein [Ferrovibrio sp.]|uniref:hypothetical protein n=1 Tax=Ferrovibrio sp. TaxID=1917215 RepID=UPI0035B012F6